MSWTGRSVPATRRSIPAWSVRCFAAWRLGPWLAVGGLILSATAGAGAQVSIGVNRILQVESTPTGSCQGLRGVLGNISDAAYNKRYLVRLEPGEFYCGGSSLVIPSWVTVEGSGRKLTFITGAVDSAVFGVVHLLSHSTLRSLKVDNTRTSGLYGGIAVSSFGVGSSVTDVLIQEVELDAASSGPNNFAIQATGAFIEVDRALLEPVKVTNGAITVKYSQLNGITSSGTTVTCLFSYGLAKDPLGPDCLP